MPEVERLRCLDELLEEGRRRDLIYRIEHGLVEPLIRYPTERGKRGRPRKSGPAEVVRDEDGKVVWVCSQ